MGRDVLQHYRDVRYECGEYMTADIIPVFRKPGERRRKAKPTSAIQEKLNQRHSEMKLFRKAHANFTSEDVALHLTYDELPGSLEQARRDLKNYLERVRRARKKEGLPDLKYITVTEISVKGRVHHHIIMSGGIDRDRLEQIWGKGYANSKRLRFGEDGITGLTRYMAKDHLTYRRWNGSKNLVDPKPKTRDYTLSRSEVMDLADKKIMTAAAVRAFPGWELVECEPVRNGVNAGVYVKLLFRRAATQGRPCGGRTAGEHKSGFAEGETAAPTGCRG